MPKRRPRSAALEALGQPVWCRGRSPLTTRLRNLDGEVGELTTCSGAQVSRGDIILADENGVVLLDPAEAPRHAAAAVRLEQEEAEIIQGLKILRTRDHARADVFDDIERFHNSKRRHSRLGYPCPRAFEARAVQALRDVRETFSRPSRHFAILSELIQDSGPSLRKQRPRSRQGRPAGPRGRC